MIGKYLSVAIAGLFICFGVPTKLMAECADISPTNQPRLIIPLFKYSGAEVGEAQNQFSQYKGIIVRKLSALIDELPQYTYLENLDIHLPGGLPITDTLTNRQRRQAYWTDTHALELLRGTLWSGTPYFVDSEIYIGDLRGRFPRNEVHMRFAIEPENVPSTNDTHSLVTYYVLAMDARRLKCEPALVRRFLSNAYSILEDLKGRSGGLDGDLAAMEAIIKDELSK